jgi:photosystem II stability/assembly factor-like uncharacterized protein
MNLTFLLFIAFPLFSPLIPAQPLAIKTKTGATNLALKSLDGGKTWQDISEGLPNDWDGENLFVDAGGLHVKTGDRLLYHQSASSGAEWTRQAFPGGNSSVAPGRSGIYAFKSNGEILEKRNGTTSWSPIFTNLHQALLRTVYETAGGTIFVGTDMGLFRSTDKGKNWKQTFNGGWVIKMTESNGLLLATSQQGILKSEDNGDHWDRVLNEGGVGIDIQPIQGGFAAIIYNSRLMYRTVKATYNGGKTWKPIDTGLPADLLTSSIIEVGSQFFCGHPAGVFKSADKGQTWSLVLPAKNNKVFNLFVSGNVIYAIARSGGC